MGNQITHRAHFGDPFRKDVISTIKAAIDDALASFETSRQKCLIAGQMLYEIKPHIPHGEFQNYVERNFPKITHSTANRWMQAAENIVKFLPPPDALDIEVSVLLTTDTAKLSGPEAKYKQMLLDLNGNTTLRDAANGVFNEGDEAHRITRAVNGKTKGGKGNVDRKDFPQFIAKALRVLTAHLAHYDTFSAAQLDTTKVRVREHIAKWPTPFLSLLKQEITESLKTR